jgi:hypothetical protein
LNHETLLSRPPCPHHQGLIAESADADTYRRCPFGNRPTPVRGSRDCCFDGPMETSSWEATIHSPDDQQSSAIALGSLLLLGRATLCLYVGRVAAPREKQQHGLGSRWVVAGS